MKRKNIRLAIAENHQTAIDELLAILHDHAHLKAIIITTDPQELLRQMTNTPVDVLFADIALLYHNGQELAKRVKEIFPAVKMVALFENEQDGIVNTMLKEGTLKGHVLRGTDKKTIHDTLEQLMAGQPAGSHTSEIRPEASVPAKATEERQLTDRELQVIKLIEQECSNKQIAERLFISERTVETHRKNIFRKTKTSSVIGLIKYAYEHKLV